MQKNKVIHRKHSVAYQLNFLDQLGGIKFMLFKVTMAVPIVLLTIDLHFFVAPDS